MNAFSDGFRAGYGAGYFAGLEKARKQAEQCAVHIANTFLMSSAAERPLLQELERREAERQKAIEREQANAKST